MFCNQCGKEFGAKDKFCKWCGTTLSYQDKSDNSDVESKENDINDLENTDFQFLCPVCNDKYFKNQEICPTCGNNFKNKPPIYFKSEMEHDNQNNKENSELLSGWWWGFFLSWIGVIIAAAINSTKKPNEAKYSIDGAIGWCVLTSIAIFFILLFYYAYY